MKVLTAVLLLALALGVAPVVFASDVSAADQTDNSLIVKEGSINARASQTTGEIGSENISKIDLNVATKPDVTVNVENSTTAEPAKAEITDIASVQNVGNSTKTKDETNLTNIQSENSQKLTNKGTKSIKAQDWGDEVKKWGRYAWDQLSATGRYIIEHIENFTKRAEINYTRTENSSGNYTSLTGRIYR